MSSPAPSILIIDDDQSIRSLVALHIRNAGYEVLEAEDAMQGGHLALERSPQLLVVDVNMPYMSGFELVSALKDDAGTRDIPVVFLSVDDDLAGKAKQLGAVAYLRKPVRADKLIEVIKQHIG